MAKGAKKKQQETNARKQYTTDQANKALAEWWALVDEQEAANAEQPSMNRAERRTRRGGAEQKKKKKKKQTKKKGQKKQQQRAQRAPSLRDFLKRHPQIPRQTFYNWIKQGCRSYTDIKRSGPSTLLSEDVEQALGKWLLTMADKNYCVDVHHFLVKAEQLRVLHGGADSKNRKGVPSTAWLDGFLDRWVRTMHSNKQKDIRAHAYHASRRSGIKDRSYESTFLMSSTESALMQPTRRGCASGWSCSTR